MNSGDDLPVNGYGSHLAKVIVWVTWTPPPLTSCAVSPVVTPQGRPALDVPRAPWGDGGISVGRQRDRGAFPFSTKPKLFTLLIGG